jgi:hypothetical protein
MELKERVCSCGLELLESDIRPVVKCCIGVHGKESLGFMKSVEILEQMADFMLSASTAFVG